MRPKWTRYLAMGVALLLAVLMLATLIVPYLSLWTHSRGSAYAVHGERTDGVLSFFDAFFRRRTV